LISAGGPTFGGLRGPGSQINAMSSSWREAARTCSRCRSYWRRFNAVLLPISALVGRGQAGHEIAAEMAGLVDLIGLSGTGRALAFDDDQVDS